MDKEKFSITKNQAYVLLALLIIIFIAALYINYQVRNLPLVETNETEIEETNNDVLNDTVIPIANTSMDSSNDSNNSILEIINDTFPELNTTCSNLS